MPLPLSGIRVLDLSHLLPGPLLTLMLADLGAEVIKIEKGPYGDANRQVPPFFKNRMSTYFAMLNRNKKSRVLDLKSKQGKKEFLTMAKQSDILVENFRPGVMKRLGLNYDALKKINPRLIYCAISGYGQDTKWKDVPGHDLNYMALSGILAATAYKNKRPAILPTQLADIAGGTYLPLISILSALHLRHKTNKGLFIDSAMLTGTLTLMQMVMGKHFLTGEELFQESDRMTGKFPNYTLYETKDKKYMAVGAIEAKFWSTFCEVIRKPKFKKWVPASDPPGFPTKTLAAASDRTIKQMKQKVGAVFKTKTQLQWKARFKKYPDGCCTPVQGMGEALAFLKCQRQSQYFRLKGLPQWKIPFGNPKLSRKTHQLPPVLDE